VGLALLKKAFGVERLEIADDLLEGAIAINE
jgi:hypothetical protein